MSGGIVVRRAVTADVDAAARCQLACWWEAYHGLVEPDRLATVTGDVDRRIERWTAAVEGGAERWLALHPDADLAPVADKVIGFSAPGLARDTDSPQVLELYAIYVRQPWWGTGLGDRLVRVAIGDEPACLWVFETNLRARSFYTRHGFQPDGARKHDPLFGLTEIRMRRSGAGAT